MIQIKIKKTDHRQKVGPMIWTVWMASRPWACPTLFLILVFVAIHLDQVPLDCPIEFEIIFYKAYLKNKEKKMGKRFLGKSKVDRRILIPQQLLAACCDWGPLATRCPRIIERRGTS